MNSKRNTFNNIDQYKEYINFKSMSDIEKDIAILDFECINKNFKDPNQLFDFKMRGFIKIAQKYKLDALDCFNRAASNKTLNK